MWGLVEEDQFRILNPEQVYELVRKPLKVSSRTRDFAEEIGKLRRLSRSQKEELLGEERARVREEEWTPEEQATVAEFESRLRDEQIVERMADALGAIEEAYPESQAVFITGGMGLTLSTDTNASEDSSSETDQQESGLSSSRIEFIDDESIASFIGPYAWPVAHNVRPARQSLGVTGCTECHSETATLFHSSVTPISVLPNVEPAAMEAHELQDVDMVRLSLWSQMFAGRSLFKVAALIVFGLTCLISMAAMASGLSGLWRRTRCR
jgi:hypothetical protein